MIPGASRSLLVLIGLIVVAAAVPVPESHIIFDVDDGYWGGGLSPPVYYPDAEDYDDLLPPWLTPMGAPFMGKKPPPPGAQNSGRAAHPPTDGHPTAWHPVIIPRPPPGRPRPVRPVIPRFWNGKHVLF